MNKRTSSSIVIAVFALLMFGLFQGCDKEEVLQPDELAPPTGLKALSLDGGIRVSWTASSTEGRSSFSGYRILVRNSSSAVVDSQQVAKTVHSYDKTSGLVNGQTYTISIHSVEGADISEAAVIQWGPTRRFPAVTIYEYASANPSGLQFSTGSALAFVSGPPGNNQSKIDLWIDGRGNTAPLLKSPDDQSISTGWRKTQFAETNATSLDALVDLPTNFRDTPGLAIVAGKVYFAKTADNNYVRFQVSGVSGTSPNRSVSITIAYNSGTGAWAKQ